MAVLQHLDSCVKCPGSVNYSTEILYRNTKKKFFKDVYMEKFATVVICKIGDNLNVQ